MPSRFETRKQKVLEQLDAPDDEYHDLSPKGSIDAPIRDLIRVINGLEGLVTTSSCSGRISVFLEGPKAGIDSAKPHEASFTGPGGKGGGSWLFISHETVTVDASVDMPSFTSMFRLQKYDPQSTVPQISCRYIHLKFEPMILHIMAGSLEDSQRILTAALSGGFRESGAVSLNPSRKGELNPMVAVRSTGYSFDAIIGYQDNKGVNLALVDEPHFRMLIGIANERFNINSERIARFKSALLEQYYPQPAPFFLNKPEWEDAEARKQRKRDEGLARQRALKFEEKNATTTAQSSLTEQSNFDGIFGS